MEKKYKLMDNSLVKTETVDAPALDTKHEQEVAKLEVAPEMAKVEIGGPKGPEPTRYGDWEIAGKCVDF